MTGQAPLHPPRPGLTLRVGVTGHRPNRENFNAQRLRSAIGVCLARIHGALRDTLKADVDCGAEQARLFSGEAPQPILISALAEGTDSIASEAALAEGFKLHAPLPFARETYAEDFGPGAPLETFRTLLTRAERVLDLPGRREEDTLAYETVGLVTARLSDLILTVWDKEPARGRGGTFDILTRALAAGIPALWFLPNGEGPFLLEADPASNADPRDLVETAQHRGPLDEPAIRALIDRVIAAPTGEDRDRLLAFFGERPLAAPPDDPGALSTLEAGLADAGLPLPAPQRTVLKPRLEAAHGLARRLGAVMALSDMGAAGLPLLSGVFLLTALVAPRSFAGPGLAAGLVCAALAAAVILATDRLQIARRARDYAALSGALREGVMVSLWAAPMPRPAARAQAGEGWHHWYVRASLREVGMPEGRAAQLGHRDLSNVLLGAEIPFQLARLAGDAAVAARRQAILDQVAAWLIPAPLASLGLALGVSVLASMGWLGAGAVDEVLQDLAILGILALLLGAFASGLVRWHRLEETSRRARFQTERLRALLARRHRPASFASLSNMVEDIAQALMPLSSGTTLDSDVSTVFRLSEPRPG